MWAQDLLGHAVAAVADFVSGPVSAAAHLAAGDCVCARDLVLEIVAALRVVGDETAAVAAGAAAQS